jgi:hypothetical protein
MRTFLSSNTSIIIIIIIIIIIADCVLNLYFSF